MYYAMKKNLIWLLVILSIIFAIPVTAMIGSVIWKDYDNITETVPKISVGNFFN